MKADILPSQIIGQNVDDVGALFGEGHPDHRHRQAAAYRR